MQMFARVRSTAFVLMCFCLAAAPLRAQDAYGDAFWQYRAIVGVEIAAKAPPDGYTLLVARIATHAILPALESKLAYKWNEFTMLSMIVSGSPMIPVSTRKAPKM